MNRELIAERLDLEVDDLVRNSQSPARTYEGNPLLAIAAELCLLPSQEFKEELEAELLAGVDAFESDELTDVRRNLELGTIFYGSAPALAPMEFSVLPAHPRNLLLSFVSHAAVVALIVSGIWVGRRTIAKPSSLSSELTYLPMPIGENAPHGGGSGGDRSAIEASRGTPPKFSNEQLASPAIVVRNPVAKLQVDPSVLGPPDLKLPESNQIGELLSRNVVFPSNGIGSGGGIGNHDGTGIGSGKGPGVGGGSDGGCCSGTYLFGNGVSAPRALYDPEPEYSEEARRVKLQGVVVLSLVVDQSGQARSIRVARSLGMGLDEKAVEAVQKWKFAPGMKDGYPVAAPVEVEVSFHLY